MPNATEQCDTYHNRASRTSSPCPPALQQIETMASLNQGFEGTASDMAAAMAAAGIKMPEVEAAAQQILAAMPRVDLFVANAGVMMPAELELSHDGIELQFATNHLGHFHLTQQILPALTHEVRELSTLVPM